MLDDSIMNINMVFKEAYGTETREQPQCYDQEIGVIYFLNGILISKYQAVEFKVLYAYMFYKNTN